VGDEDQSIYRFRGADYRNVQLFREDYPDHIEILLEQNYRSTQTILDVANALISQNRHRTPKRLHTDNGQGVPVMVYEAYNEVEEAAFVADEIEKLLASKAFQPAISRSPIAPTRRVARLKRPLSCARSSTS
jgi:DNA helicase-2/ATP-dependent DNA helicase PcrA